MKNITIETKMAAHPSCHMSEAGLRCWHELSPGEWASGKAAHAGRCHRTCHMSISCCKSASGTSRLGLSTLPGLGCWCTWGGCSSWGRTWYLCLALGSLLQMTLLYLLAPLVRQIRFFSNDDFPIPIKCA